MKKTNRENIIEANVYGLNVGWEGGSYYTPILEMARTLGCDGIDLRKAKVVTGYRYGKASEFGISQNYRDNISEKGLSLAALKGKKEIGSSMWFSDREKYEYTGIYVTKGSDGEPIILPFGFEVFD